MKQRSQDITALHEKTVVELQAMQEEVQLELAQARLARDAGKLADTASVKQLSDAIARIKTIITEKQFAAAVAATVEQKEEK